VLRYALFQVPFYFSGLVFVSLVASRHNYSTLSFVAAGGLVVKLISNAALVPLIGLNGLVLANTFVYGFTAVLMAAMIKREKTGDDPISKR
jgi:putative peptidoglycan lipid II flippase